MPTFQSIGRLAAGYIFRHLQAERRVLMGSAQALVGSAIFSLACVLGCSAGTGNTGAGSANGGGDQGGGENNDGGNGAGFQLGGGDVGPACTDPSCVGNTPQGNCDQGLDIVGTNAMDGARAIGLCKFYEEGSWGVKGAAWVRSDGQPLTGALLDGKGVLDQFGSITPREGNSMLVISSGIARAPGDPGYVEGTGYAKMDEFFDPPHGAPPGYPKESPSCPGVITGEPYDSAGLRLTIQTPTDAKSLTYDFNFYTYEFPTFICTEWNDFFVAMMNPKVAALPDGNISFDSQGNTISVNAGFLQVCTAQVAGNKQFDCPLGPGELNGTGFETHAATSWLTTSAPIENPGGEITLDFLIWDSGDTIYDSTTLIDNFRFDLDETTTVTEPAQ
jgi:hypothetical protein